MEKSSGIKKTEMMVRYEEETGKLAVWKGQLSKGYMKWKERMEREEIRQEKLQTLKESKIAKRDYKKELAQEKIAGKDYEHLIIVENIHKTYLLRVWQGS